MEPDGQFVSYAEYLPRIASLLVSFQLPDSSCVVTALSLEHGGSCLRVTLNNKTSYLVNLPHNAYHPYTQLSTSLLQFDKDTRCFSMKLRCVNSQKDDDVNSRVVNHFMSLSSHYKWNAKYLMSLKQRDQFVLCCGHCGAEVMSSRDVVRLNELPSEFWSELMDFWHCHKPEVATGAQPSFTESLYQSAASNILKPRPKCVNVGLYYFSVNAHDFQHKVYIDVDGTNFDTGLTAVKCLKCQAPLGELDIRKNLIKILKWNLVLKTGKNLNDTEHETFHPYYFAYSSILDVVNSCATRVFKIVNTGNELGSEHPKTANVLYIWVFNIGIFATVQGEVLQNCLKVYYSYDLQNLSSKMEYEEIELPNDVLDNLIDKLEKTNAKLPRNCQKMGSWSLSLLPYENVKTASS